MTLRAWFIAILPVLLVTLVVFAATAQRVEPLVLADLRVSGVAVDDDSASVRRRLGTPVGVDANALHYPDLDVVLKDGKVAILSITGPSRATRRGLRVGVAAEAATRLYRPCHGDSTLVQICYNAPRFDERVVLVAVADGHVSASTLDASFMHHDGRAA